MRLVVGVLCSLFLTALASAQGGGFTSSDLYLYSPAIQNISITGGALVHVDLVAGTATILVDTAATITSQGPMAFDPYRQRIIFCGSVAPSNGPIRLYAVDAAGELGDLGIADKTLINLSPTGDGRIYMHDVDTPSQPLKYLDAAGVLHTLMDATGTFPYLVNGSAGYDLRDMIYDAGTNALFVASTTTCPGGAVGRINVTKLPLSADGSRVVGPEGCSQFEVSSSGEIPVGWSHGPAGQLMLVVDTNTANLEPRILLVDPATLAITVFATPGSFFGAPAVNAGTWCTSLNKAVILETLTDVLRTYGPGDSGAGTTLAITGTLSAPGSSGEVATLREIPPSSCEGGWYPYGTGLAGTGGFVPSLIGVGCPQIGNAFSLQIAHAVGGATGLLFVGLTPTGKPFKGGNFYVGGVVLQLPLSLGGALGVGDAGGSTLPAGLPNDPLLEGVQVYLQAVLHDAGAVKGASLSNAVQMEIG
jgi:hypothetical protein